MAFRWSFLLNYTRLWVWCEISHTGNTLTFLIGSGEECNYHAHFTSRQRRYWLIFWKTNYKQQSLINILRRTLNLHWIDKKVKTKNWHQEFLFRCFFLFCYFLNLSDFTTLFFVRCCFVLFCFVLFFFSTWFTAVIEGRIIYKWSAGKQKLLLFQWHTWLLFINRLSFGCFCLQCH